MIGALKKCLVNKQILQIPRIKWICGNILLSCLWIIISLSFFYFCPQKNNKDILLALRFFCLGNIYILGLWMIWNYSHHPLFVWILGIIHITSSFMIVKISTFEMEHSLLPKFWQIWLIYIIYLTLLINIQNLLQSIFKNREFVAIFLILFICLSIGNIFILPQLETLVLPIPLSEKISNQIFSNASPILTLALYLNPVILVATCFPGYDYLRGIFFYEIITSHLGPFSYPAFQSIIIFYLIFNILILSLNILIIIIKRKFFKKNYGDF